MAFWLIKSEPDSYSWDQLVKDKKTRWEGVRNFAARNHLKAMKKGDKVFYYHSNTGTEIVGIAEVIKEHHQDQTSDDANWVAVDVKPVKRLKNTVTLSQVKNDERLKDMALIRLSRLSVQPVTEQEWEIIMKLADEAS